MRLLPSPDDPATRRGGAIAAAWLLALLPSLALFAVRLAAGQASLAISLGPGFATFAAYSILAAPLIETAVMLPIGAALRHLPVQSDAPRIAVLAALAAAAHGIQGGVWSAAGSLWPFAVYAATLFGWWRRSPGDAFLVTAAVHALYNASFLALGLVASRLASGDAIPP